MKWDRAEKEVGTNVYSQKFKDSLKTAFAVADQEKLRELPEREFPFNKKEKLVYDGGWGFLRAGFCILDGKVVKGKVHVEGKAVTNNFVSTFFKVRDHARTTFDLLGLYPYFFEQHISETTYKTKMKGNKAVRVGKEYKRDNWAIYDHTAGKVHTDRKKDSLTYPIKPYSNNYLSLFYYLRTLKFTPGDTFSIDCFVHGKDYPIFFKVLGREQIKVKAGTFDCIKVEPKLVGEGSGFTKRDKMYLWFTDDKYHMMVKGKAKISLGWLSVNLLHYKRK